MGEGGEPGQTEVPFSKDGHVSHHHRVRNTDKDKKTKAKASVVSISCRRLSGEADGNVLELGWEPSFAEHISFKELFH